MVLRRPGSRLMVAAGCAAFIASADHMVSSSVVQQWPVTGLQACNSSEAMSGIVCSGAYGMGEAQIVAFHLCCHLCTVLLPVLPPPRLIFALLPLDGTPHRF